MNINNNQNENYILCINKERNLSRAAKILGISQPAVSLSLNNMEKQLGFKIFNRSKSPMELTEEGQVYIQYLLEKEQLSLDYEKKLLDISSEHDYSLVVGGSSIYVQHLLLNPIIYFEEEKKHCNIVIKEAPISELMEMTRNGKMDFFISTSNNLGDDIITEHLITEHLYLCVPADWEINKKIKKFSVEIGQRGKKFDYSLLNNEKFIFLEENQPLQNEMNAFFKEFGINAQNNIRVNQAALAVKLAGMGRGIALVTEEALWGLEYKERLLFYSLPESYESRELFIAYNSRRYISSDCNRLIELLKHNLEEKENEFKCN